MKVAFRMLNTRRDSTPFGETSAGEPPDRPVCGKQQPAADLPGRSDACSLDQAPVSRHLSGILGVHIVDALGRRRIRLEIEYRDSALGHTQQIDVADEQHAMFDCSRYRVLELELGAGP